MLRRVKKWLARRSGSAPDPASADSPLSPDSVPWLDRADWEERIRVKLASGAISQREEQLCRQYASDGYIIVGDLITPGQLDSAWEAYELFFRQNREQFPESIDPEDPWPERYLNVHHRVPEIKALLRHPQILRITNLLFGRPTKPFQTITSHKGTEQPPHGDSIHMTTEPPGYLVAAWIAFENIHPDSGPIVYYPGSHRLPFVLSDQIGLNPNEFESYGYDSYKTRYEPRIQRLIARHGFSEKLFLAQKGDVLFWHANLLHGGSLRRRLQLSRKALVCHYFADGVHCYHDLSGREADFSEYDGSGVEPVHRHEH